MEHFLDACTEMLKKLKVSKVEINSWHAAVHSKAAYTSALHMHLNTVLWNTCSLDLLFKAILIEISEHLLKQDYLFY